MADINSAWRSALDDIKRDVTGRTLWQALDAVVPIALEDSTAILGIPHEESVVIGHLRATQTKRVIEIRLSERVGRPVKAEIIVGETVADWEAIKNREQQVTQMQQREFDKARDVRDRERQWDSAYDQLSRTYAAVVNKSLPQNRARFVVVAVDSVVASIREQGELDEVGERAVGRLLDRIAQFAEVPPTQVGLLLLERLGERK